MSSSRDGSPDATLRHNYNSEEPEQHGEVEETEYQPSVQVSEIDDAQSEESGSEEENSYSLHRYVHASNTTSWLSVKDAYHLLTSEADYGHQEVSESMGNDDESGENDAEEGRKGDEEAPPFQDDHDEDNEDEDDYEDDYDDENNDDDEKVDEN